jgi:hypothetical protein
MVVKNYKQERKTLALIYISYQRKQLTTFSQLEVEEAGQPPTVLGEQQAT